MGQVNLKQEKYLQHYEPFTAYHGLSQSKTREVLTALWSIYCPLLHKSIWNKRSSYSTRSHLQSTMDSVNLKQQKFFSHSESFTAHHGISNSETTEILTAHWAVYCPSWARSIWNNQSSYSTLGYLLPTVGIVLVKTYNLIMTLHFH